MFAKHNALDASNDCDLVIVDAVEYTRGTGGGAIIEGNYSVYQGPFNGRGGDFFNLPVDFCPKSMCG